MDDNIRIALVKELANYEKPINETLEKLSKFEWDFDGQSYLMKTEILKCVLQRYIAGAVSEGNLEDWANALEGREDIKYANPKKDIVKEIIYELANPTLVGKVNVKKCNNYLKMIL